MAVSSELESSFLDTTLSSDEYKSKGKMSTISRDALERRQLLHNMELLKLTVSLKDNQLKEMKDSHTLHEEELEEKIADVSHQRQVLQARLEYCEQMHTEDKSQHGRRMAALEQSRQELNEKCNALQDELKGLMNVCDKPLLTATEFQALKSRPIDRLLPSNLLQVALYESVQPVLQEKDELAKQVVFAQQQAAECQEEASRHITMYHKEAEQRHKVQMLCTELQEQLEKHVLLKMTGEKERDLRILNYDDVLKERDAAASQCQVLQKEVDRFELRVAEAVADVSNLTEKVSAAERQVELLQQDKAYLTQQVDASKHHQHLAEDRVEEVRQRLHTTTTTLESLQTTTTAERGERHKEWNDRLSQELSAIKAQTSEEIQRIRSQSSDAVERETRLLKEALERCQLERDNARHMQLDLDSKHQALLLEFQRLESTGQNQLSECQHELQLRAFELERLRLLHTDCASKEQSAKLDATKVAKQLELVKEELHEAKREYDRHLMQADLENRSLKQRLSSYEALEKELEETLEEAAHDVNHSAGTGHEHFATATATAAAMNTATSQGAADAASGFKPSMPPPPPLLASGHFATSRHWQNRLSVARRLLQCDRECVYLRRQLADEKESVHRLQQELESNQQVLRQTQQPMSVLIQTMQSRDEQLRRLEHTVTKLQADLECVHAEKTSLLKEKTALLSDLEHLVHQQEDFTQLREAIQSLQDRRQAPRRHPDKHRAGKTSVKLALDDIEREGAKSVPSSADTKPEAYRRHQSDGNRSNRHGNTNSLRSHARHPQPVAVRQEVIQPAELGVLSQPAPTIFTKSSSANPKKRTKPH